MRQKSRSVDYATLTFLELHPDLEESILYTGGMDVSNLELGRWSRLGRDT